MDAPDCTTNGNAKQSFMKLRIAGIFILLLGSTFGALFPVLARRSAWLNVPKGVFNFAKYFGSGVIIATAFIHLLGPALDELGSDCLSPAWQNYQYALALCMLSIFSIFIVELIAFRWGTAKLARLGVTHDPHGHGIGAHAAHGPESVKPLEEKRVEDSTAEGKNDKQNDIESATSSGTDHENHGTWDGDAATKIIGIAILEFGVVLHSILIGLTLAVDPDFKILFVVIVFHQLFEGLGLGSRLAYMDLGPKYKWVPVVAALIYGCTTPLGLAVGLGVRTTYNPASATANIVSGVLDSLSSGILIYTGLVELLAHEFLFNKEMMAASNGRLAYAICSMLFGAGIMALLGRWA